LKQSILARINAGLPGLFDPIKVRYIRSAASFDGEKKEGGTPLLIDGECRLLAYRMLWDEGTQANIPVTDTDGSEVQLRAATLIGNNGLPLTPLEIGHQCKILRDGYLQSEDWIAEQIGKPRRFVTEAIALDDAPVEAKALVAAGEVTPGAVRSAVAAETKQAKAENRAPDPERIVAPLKKAVASRPAPKPRRQSSLPGVPSRPAKRPKPVARPKKKSVKEQIGASVPKNVLTLLKLADKLADVVRDNDSTIRDCVVAAKAYQAARKD
jgi:hypothetical protein